MKLIFSTLLVADLATSAVAGNSDRYNDLRLDTAVGHVTKDKAVAAPKATKPQVVTLSSSNKAKAGKGYAYSNPYGVGPANDSR